MYKYIYIYISLTIYSEIDDKKENIKCYLDLHQHILVAEINLLDIHWLKKKKENN